VHSKKILFTGQIDGSPSTGNSGWILSTSKNLLVLWKTYALTNAAEDNPPLQLSRSTSIQERIISFDVAETSKALAAACINTIDNRSYVALYSLGPNAVLDLQTIIPTASEPSQVVSLQSMGGPLRLSLACAVQKDILIYDVQSQTGAPKAQWTAHLDSPLCLLRRNFFGISLFSAAWNGSIHFWDLKSKPTQPVLKFLKHTRAVTGVEMITDSTLMSSSADGTIYVWDLRNSSAPTKTFIPDGKSVLNIRINPTRNYTAVSTLKGMYLLASERNEICELTAPDRKVVVPDMCWNANSDILYATQMEGDICVYDNFNQFQFHALVPPTL